MIAKLCRGMKRIPTDLSAAGTGSPSVLRHRILVPYVPLRTRCSASVPAADRSVGIRFILPAEFRNHPNKVFWVKGESKE